MVCKITDIIYYLYITSLKTTITSSNALFLSHCFVKICVKATVFRLAALPLPPFTRQYPHKYYVGVVFVDANRLFHQ